VAKEDRGFASMDRAKQREIASKGGKAAHQKGTAHEWTSEEAREAGRKGGMASHRRKQQARDGGQSAAPTILDAIPHDTAGVRGGRAPRPAPTISHDHRRATRIIGPADTCRSTTRRLN
jgi:general stress protein YciG